MVEEKRFGMLAGVSIARAISGVSITVRPPRTRVFPLSVMVLLMDVVPGDDTVPLRAFTIASGRRCSHP